ncbi:MAG: long-chain-fatty-acyl-CoA reductase, partial [Eubacteriales bacterium]|nr:long-chain-fatty-acyl-CoA reductase [Eubacteriales bacterium]
IDRELMNYKYNSGFYFEKEIEDLGEITDVCDIRCQTVTYFGVSKEDFAAFLEKARPVGIDRIVPMGKSMDFALIWDGYDLIRQMSRRVTIL